MKYLMGIDLGGTKIEGVVLESGKKLNILARKRILTEQEKGYQHILDNIKHLVTELEKQVNYTFPYIGIGTPGSTDSKTGLLKNSNTLCLNGKEFSKDLEQKLGKKVNIANDANCFAIAEAQFGVVRQSIADANVIFGVIMGTGAGGGVVVNGKVINGLHGIGGEWGHNFLDESGGLCYCGKTGCTETVISGPATEKYYYKLSGEHRKLKDIVKSYRTGNDEYATATIQRLMEMFGKAISVIINIIDPDAIVLGGGVGNIEELYTQGVKEAKKHIFNSELNTPFLKPNLGDSAGVIGAALL